MIHDCTAKRPLHREARTPALAGGAREEREDVVNDTDTRSVPCGGALGARWFATGRQESRQNAFVAICRRKMLG